MVPSTQPAIESAPPTLRPSRLARCVQPLAEVDDLYLRLSRAHREADAREVSRLHADDALYVTPERQRLHGRLAIAGWYAELFGKAVERGIALDVRFFVTERGTQNGVVYDVGTYVLTGRTDTDSVPLQFRTGRFLAVLRRSGGEAGRYRIVRFSSFSPDVAA